jgi:ABC-type lipoprotein release transport system permease subunit
VAVVSEAGAKALWPGQDPIGRKLVVPHPNFELKRLDFDELTVVGVAADPVRRSGTSPIWANRVLFVPLDGNQATLIVTRSTDPAAQVEPIRRTVRALDPVVALVNASARENREQLRLAALNRVDAAMAIVSALAVAVSTIGVYGLMSFFASTRKSELAVRMALGASPASITVMMIRQAVRIVLLGLLPGVLAASLLSRVLQAHVVDFMPNDVSTWTASVLLVLLSGVAASYLPARRAASDDPAMRLRHL